MKTPHIYGELIVSDHCFGIRIVGLTEDGVPMAATIADFSIHDFICIMARFGEENANASRRASARTAHKEPKDRPS